ncbi:MAG: DUF2061 domain-containing protein [Rhizobiales bacterium]|nr:DUF2061 domain-containing protein [Hyphomicrobiales bacterium]
MKLDLKKLGTPSPAKEKPWRSVAKAASWRVVGTLDTFLLSILLITFLGPLFDMEPAESHTALVQTAGAIALTEVATKLIFYYLHERFWTNLAWGVTSDGQRRNEHNLRSTVKMATWRILASLDTMLLAWFFTGNFKTALSIGSAEVATKLVLYYIHERVWLRLSFGISMDNGAERAMQQARGGDKSDK